VRASSNIKECCGSVLSLSRYLILYMHRNNHVEFVCVLLIFKIEKVACVV